jgi:hypothetical protein
MRHWNRVLVASLILLSGLLLLPVLPLPLERFGWQAYADVYYLPAGPGRYGVGAIGLVLSILCLGLAALLRRRGGTRSKMRA